MTYNGKIVLITGTSRGVGNKLAEYYLKENATVIGISTSNFSLNGLYDHYKCDLSNGNEIKDTFRKISKNHSCIDIVINNAAILTSQYSLIMPVKNAEDMVKTNLLGTFFVSREAAKLMRKSEYGRIINIGSMAVSLEPKGDSIYAACKAGIGTITNIMAKELSTYKITCNTLGITAIETDMLNQLPREKIDEIIKTLPIPRYATINDIINVINFFCSEKSSYITAQTIYLGGIH
ncbi:MAG: SDR family NAD(P)-dependent oxidoreductase [Saprospiraceae bacterium]